MKYPNFICRCVAGVLEFRHWLKAKDRRWRRKDPLGWWVATILQWVTILGFLSWLLTTCFADANHPPARPEVSSQVRISAPPAPTPPPLVPSAGAAKD